jgi:hypothetical protein
LDIFHGSSLSSTVKIINPEYKFHMYYTGYRILTFVNGFVYFT